MSTVANGGIPNDVSFTEVATFNTPETDELKSTVVGQLDPHRKLAIIFTCTVCSTRNAKTFSHMSYTKGVVIITCDGCKKHHLIADNLGWFRNTPVNIETIAKEKGETVQRIQDLSYLLKEDVYKILPQSLKEKVDKALKHDKDKNHKEQPNPTGSEVLTPPDL